MNKEIAQRVASYHFFRPSLKGDFIQLDIDKGNFWNAELWSASIVMACPTNVDIQEFCTEANNADNKYRLVDLAFNKKATETDDANCHLWFLLAAKALH